MARVLIVDDDKFTRSVLRDVLAREPVLRDLGVEVLTAEDGEKGLEMYDAHRPQVVIVDLLMPKKDGFSVCETIRTRSDGRDVHLAAVSGVYRDAALAFRLKEQYGARLFSKPYQIQELARYVTDVLARLDQDLEPEEIASEEARARSGSLSERTLPAVLLDLWEEQATGRLALRCGRVEKEVGLAFGHPVFVTSNVRTDTLGYFLTARGVITEAQHTAALERASQKKQRLGAALLEIGLLKPEQLVAALTDQIRFKLGRCLRWSTGRYSFEPSVDPPAGAHGEALDMVEVIFRGLSAGAGTGHPPEELVGRALELTERGRRLMPAIRLHLSETFADRWTPGMTAEALVSGGDETKMLAVLEILSMCEGVRAVETAGGPKPAAPPGAGKESPEAGADASSADPLYALLFGDTAGLPRASSSGALPIEVSDEDEEKADPTVTSLERPDPTPAGERELRAAHRQLLEEYLRIQDISHYEVLEVEPQTEPAEIATALAEKRSRYSFEFFARFDLGRDYAKLEEIQGAYDRAGEVLLDDDRRREYDATLSGSTPPAGLPVLDADLAARHAQELLGRGDYPAARVKIETAIEAAPNEAAYHAALGWIVYLDQGRDARAADAARPHINHALALDPDQPAAHEYKGIIADELGTDDAEAAFHLERALDASASRDGALEALERLRRRRGELRHLERQYRRMLYQVAGQNPQRELDLWLKLGQLYLSDLDERDDAIAAYRAALRLDSNHPGAQAALAELESDAEDPFFQGSRRLREEWVADPKRDRLGRMLVSASLKASRWDAAFIAASALVAHDSADEQAEELYRRYRPRFLIRAQRMLDDELWRRVTHPDDSPAIGALFAILEPVVLRVAPIGLAEGELDEGTPVADEDLPASFLRVRAYVAHFLGVEPPQVYARPDFERQIHVGATNPPVLLAGDEAIASPERSELGFRLGRAMTFLKPGRALAGAYSGGLLKQVVLAAYSSASPNPVAADDPDGLVERLVHAIRELPGPARDRVRDLVSELSTRHRTLDLSRWSRALARTGDRVGLLLCADLPAALRFTTDGGGPDASRDLFEFALSAEHLSLRAELGLSVDV